MGVHVYKVLWYLIHGRREANPVLSRDTRHSALTEKAAAVSLGIIVLMD